MKVTELVQGKAKPVYATSDVALYLGDALSVLGAVQPGSIDMVFADPPYFLSNDGITCKSGKIASVNKGAWDKISSRQAKHEFNREWIRLCRRALSLDGTIWISGTMHNIYSIGTALEQEDFRILNNITWQKTNPPPNLACRCFTHSTETILWAQKSEKKAKHYFNYSLMKDQNGGKQMKDVWTGPSTPLREKSEGKHPTQKPLYLLTRIIESSTCPGDTVLDPFCGSSTTGVAAVRLGRRYIGIDSVGEYTDLSKRRLENEHQ